MRQHKEDDLHRRREALEAFGYQFHITSQRWLVKLYGNPVCSRELYDDDGGMSSDDHKRQQKQNMLEALNECDLYHNRRLKAHHDQMTAKQK